MPVSLAKPASAPKPEAGNPCKVAHNDMRELHRLMVLSTPQHGKRASLVGETISVFGLRLVITEHQGDIVRVRGASGVRTSISRVNHQLARDLVRYQRETRVRDALNGI